jgi:hypothetical protein
MHDLDRAGIVDAEIAGGIDQGERLVAARLNLSLRRDDGGAHALGQIGRMGHVAAL